MPLNKAVTSPPLKLRHTVYSPICIKGCSLRTRTRQLFPAKGVCNWSLCFLPADKAGGSPRNTRHLQPPSALPGGRHRRDHRPLQAGPAPARAPPPHPSRLPSAAFPVRRECTPGSTTPAAAGRGSGHGGYSPLPAPGGQAVRNAICFLSSEDTAGTTKPRVIFPRLLGPCGFTSLAVILAGFQQDNEIASLQEACSPSSEPQ